jgi:hypothetical protein
MAYKIRVILNAKEDVIRDIAIDESETLEDLHNAITNAFGFDGHEMASFYRADKEWNQGEEFPLFDMDDEFSDILTMSELPIDTILTKPSEKLIYVYDFFNMWSFYVELIDTDFHSTNLELPSLVFSLGAVPKTAPDVKFENDKKSGPKVEEDFDEFDDDDEDDEDLDEFYEEDYDSF